MLHIVASFIGLIKARLHTNIDSTVFRLHYRWTTSFCFLACALVSATEYIGNAIQCLGSGTDQSPKAINTYCWIMSTHTLDTYGNDETFYKSRGSNFQGTGNYDPGVHEITYHTYYQWVPFFLFFQGCLFYLPHLLWKTIEGKTADKLLQGLQYYSMDEEKDKKRENIVKYLKETRGHNLYYAISYLMCEALNFVNVMAQVFLLDKFLDGAFLNFGIKLMYPGTHAAPLTSTFPRMTKCHFRYHGTSGEIAKDEYICLLPQNILNEKVFIVMWFWLITLATITAIELIWRVTVVVSPFVRIQLMEQRGKLTADPKLEKTIRMMQLGDFCLLYNLGTNLDAGNFRDLLLAYTNCHDNSVHPNNDDTSYRPYSRMDDGTEEDKV
ncbi:Innexin inx2 [Chionoecetes opilio]|uniref:Innexin n=1 Tax=Chionoecetes opilio TaxID=41210 RepID=A0A8J8WCU2_CHIOP|nr:Innexin inx2 [Chionoecetes opilio]